MAAVAVEPYGVSHLVTFQTQGNGTGGSLENGKDGEESGRGATGRE